eukprot:8155253-Pyramimonas_sp.AAC.1
MTLGAAGCPVEAESATGARMGFTSARDNLTTRATFTSANGGRRTQARLCMTHATHWGATHTA